MLLEKAVFLVLGSFCSSVPGPGLRGKLCGLDNTRYSVEDVALGLRSVFTAQPGGTFERVPPTASPSPLKTPSSFQCPGQKTWQVLTTLFLLSANLTGFFFRMCPGCGTPHPFHPWGLSPRPFQETSFLPASKQDFPQPNLCLEVTAIFLKAGLILLTLI